MVVIPRWAERLGAPILTIVAVLVVIGTSRAVPGISIEHQLPSWAIVLSLVGAASITLAAWMVGEQSPGASLGLAIVGIALLLPSVAGWTWVPAQIRAGSIAVAPAAIAGLAHVAARWRTSAVWVPAGRVVGPLAGVAVVILLIGYDPFEDPGCARTCVDIEPMAQDWLSTRSAAFAAAFAAVGAAGLGAVIVSTSARPMVPPPISAAIGIALVLLALGWLAWIVTWGQPTTIGPVLQTVPGYAASALVGCATILVTARTRWARRAMRRLVETLSDPAGTIRDRRGTIGDVEFWSGDGRWLDRTGRPVETRDDPRQVVIRDFSGPVVRLAVANGVDHADILRALTPGALLALRNEQLALVTRARLDEVQASRRRIVAASDAERQRIERDLHDGAQQRLVSAAFHLSLARRRSPSTSDELTVAEQAVRDALAELRRLSHGPFPTILASEGLEAALEELTRASDTPATLVTSGDLTVGLEPATAAYATVAASLQHARQGAPAQIEVSRDRAVLVVRITFGGEVPDDSRLVDLADRVGAAGGELRIILAGDDTTMEARLPCES